MPNNDDGDDVLLQGDHCEDCLPLYVGNPHDGGKCTSCWEVCKEHSEICLSLSHLKLRPELIDVEPFNVSRVSLLR